MAHFFLTLALFMHGIGHVLFAANARGYWKSDTGQGWLFGQAKPMSRTVEGMLGLLWLLPLAGFLVGAWGFYTHTAGWQSWLLAAAILSSLLILLWWGSINTSGAFFALLFNIIVIGVVLWQRQSVPLAG